MANLIFHACVVFFYEADELDATLHYRFYTHAARLRRNF